jgi:thiol-disulfide isomerase/thioredoxin
MWGSINRFLLIIGLTGLMILSSCEKPNSEDGAYLPHPTETQGVSRQATVPVESMDSDPYPAPGNVNRQGIEPTQILSAYPDSNVESDFITDPSGTSSAYPAPDTIPYLQTTPVLGAYPEPSSSGATDNPSSGTGDVSNTPTIATPTSLQNPILVQTQRAQVPSQTIDATQPISATPTATPPLVRTQLEASDPSSFQLASGQVQFVEFFAFWSPLSQSMAPVVFRLEDRYQGRINFVYLDIDDPANDLFKQLIDDRLPPIYYLVDGEGNVLGEWSGYVMEGTFTATIESVIQ